jgi:Protein of unknown function (DUF2924)
MLRLASALAGCRPFPVATATGKTGEPGAAAPSADPVRRVRERRFVLRFQNPAEDRHHVGASVARTRPTVLLRENGFEYEGQHYHSLTAIATKITGAHWSGPRFFGLTRRAGASVAEVRSTSEGGAAAIAIAPLLRPRRPGKQTDRQRVNDEHLLLLAVVRGRVDHRRRVSLVKMTRSLMMSSI